MISNPPSFGPQFVVTSPTESAIRAARASAVAAGGGTVVLPDATITIAAALPCDSGVRYVGVPPRFTYAGVVPDSDWVFAGGTVLQGDGTFPCFTANTASVTTPDSHFADTAISNFGLSYIGFSNFTTAVYVGGHNNVGLQFSELSNLWITGCADWALNITNFMVTKVSRVYMKAGVKGLRFAADVANTTLSPGNSKIDTIYGATVGLSGASSLRKMRGIVFEGVGTSFFNQMFVDRVQFNAFGRTLLSQSATLTNGSANITVADGTAFEIGMPVAFTTTANGFTASRIYVVKTIAGNVLTLGSSRSGADVTSSGTTGMTLTSYGMPCLEIVGGGSSGVSNSSFYGIDVEGFSGAAIYVENSSGITLDVSQLPSGANVNAHIVGRTAATTTIRNPGYPAITDLDGNSTVEFYGYRGAILQRPARGIWTEQSSGITRLTITSPGVVSTGDLSARQPTGGTFLYPENGAIGSRVAVLNTTNSLNAFYGGMLVYAGTSAVTWTLPTVAESTALASNVGLPFEIVNAGTNNITLNTDGTQLFNRVTAKTSYTITPGQTIKVVGAKTAAGAYFWAAFPSNGVT